MRMLVPSRALLLHRFRALSTTQLTSLATSTSALASSSATNPTTNHPTFTSTLLIMHASSSSSSAAHTCQRSAPSSTVAIASTPVSCAVVSEPAPANAGSPQCCHCGWRGAHAPTCPFK
ncbi:uncharacterized protein BXZ73DRAFT_101464 [Epithele typhae]|uniref:uncharacterized protein n=1 Tax=Epithele typhae TaxID=378194 RepID=UPI00200899EA|nr:uncharacterized protein BXZ73DRAFT_101464 [Epithele typhae]KAH9932087.1 hypothetical protein BXZ73DRAFT_101464 [Epithele typhae]